MNLTDDLYNMLANNSEPTDVELAKIIQSYEGDFGAYNHDHLGGSDYTLIHHLIGRSLWRSALALIAKVQTINLDAWDRRCHNLHVPNFLDQLSANSLIQPRAEIEIRAYMLAVSYLNETSEFFFNLQLAIDRSKKNSEVSFK